MRIVGCAIVALALACGGPPVPEPHAPAWQRELDELRARHFLEHDLQARGRRRLAVLLDFEAGLAEQAREVYRTLGDERAMLGLAWLNYERGAGPRPEPGFGGHLDPNDPESVRAAWLAAGSDAVTLAQTWARRWPRDASAWFALGWARAQVTGEHVRAAAALRRALAIDPRHTAARAVLEALPDYSTPTPAEVIARPCPPGPLDIAASRARAAGFRAPADVAAEFAEASLVVVHEAYEDRVAAGGRWRTRHRLLRLRGATLSVPADTSVERLRVHHLDGRMSPASLVDGRVRFYAPLVATDLVELRTVTREPPGPFDARLAGEAPAMRRAYTAWLPEGVEPRGAGGAPTALPVDPTCAAPGWRYVLEAVGGDRAEPYAPDWWRRVPHVSVGRPERVEAIREAEGWRWSLKLRFAPEEGLRGVTTLDATGPGTGALRASLGRSGSARRLESLLADALPGVVVDQLRVRRDGPRLRLEATISVDAQPDLLRRAVLVELPERPDPRAYAGPRRTAVQTRPLLEVLHLELEAPPGWHIASEWDSFELADGVVDVRQVVQRRGRSLTLERTTRVHGALVPRAVRDVWENHLGALAVALHGRLTFERGERR